MYLGISVTFFWFLVFGLLLAQKWEEASGMSLNEWGDFAAGATAPIAFLWLVIGYHLQREELKQNTDALKEQRDELAKQNKNMEANTEATKELAKSIKFTGMIIKNEISSQGSNNRTHDMLWNFKP